MPYDELTSHEQEVVRAEQVDGTSFDGLPRTANLGVRVVPASVGLELPASGSEAEPLLVLALALFGIGLILTARRRNPGI